RGDALALDFAGSGPQCAGDINVVYFALVATVYYALKAVLDPTIPANSGFYRAITVTAPEGSIVNARLPAPVAWRTQTCQRIADVVFGALAPALPERVIGATNGANSAWVFSGTDPRTGQYYVYLETIGGGSGARATKDGLDGVQVHITNTSNLPVEAIEMEYPLRVVSYGLIEDSGGAGEFRGGLGLRRVIEPVAHDCVFNGAGERFRNAPWGIFGGGPGGMGRFLHVTDQGERTLDIKPSGIAVKAGERIVVETPGAGGYGPPERRDAAALEEDRQSGKFGEKALKEKYGDIGGVPSHPSTGSG
ncbi:MAG: hydantoinase B/oxoprolinase family protein, partial [Alphaproteobacteria bacterium]